MSSFWSWFVILLVVINVGGSAWLLFAMRKTTLKSEDNTTGHEYDGIKELNNPLPRWWIWLFVITIIFSVVYAFLYPTLGNYIGYFDWSSSGQHQSRVAASKKKYAPLFEKYYSIPVEKLAKNASALKIGERLYASNCATCHGANAKGAKGFPNLTDNDWLYGGAPSEIEKSILYGRRGAMPGWKAALGGDSGVNDMVAYVQSLNGKKVDDAAKERGMAKYKFMCTGCHGDDAKGKQILGAPDLTNNIWLYGGSKAALAETIGKGRNGMMPAQHDILGKEKVRILTAYIYHLSHPDKQAGE